MVFVLLILPENLNFESGAARPDSVSCLTKQLAVIIHRVVHATEYFLPGIVGRRSVGCPEFHDEVFPPFDFKDLRTSFKGYLVKRIVMVASWSGVVVYCFPLIELVGILIVHLEIKDFVCLPFFKFFKFF